LHAIAVGLLLPIYCRRHQHPELLQNIFRKLAANGRTYAISKALRQQIITPASIRTPYQNR
jgi:hypothetical protein